MEFKRALAAATALLALFLIYSFFAAQTGGEEPEPAPSPGLKAELLGTQKIGGAVLETYSLEGNYTASITAPYTMSLFTVLPADAEFKQTSSEPPSPPSPITENAFSDEVPAGSFNRSVSLAGEGAPLFLAGNESQGSDWERVLRKASALELNASEAIALQEKMNEALSIAYVTGNYSALEELVDYAKNVTETRIINPDYDAEKAIRDKELPEENDAADYEELLSETLSKTPEGMVFELSEKSLEKTKTFYLELPAELGDPLVSTRLTGSGKGYFSVEEEVSMEDGFYGVRQIELKITADVSSAVKNGEIVFDEEDAVLRVELGSPFLVKERETETELKIVVEHVIVADESKTPEATFESAAEDFEEKEFAAFICPTPGRRTAPYGYSQEYFDGKQWHTGVDIGHTAVIYDPVYASATGIVQSVYSSGNCGNGALINHYLGGVEMQTLYCHLNEVIVEPGQAVVQGQQIGVKGDTGNSLGVHLHFEIRVNGEKVNPEEYVSFRVDGYSRVCDPEAVPSQAKKVFVDPGHGCNSGAESGGVREADLNKEVARQLVAILEARGFETNALYSTCENEYEISDRYETANEWGADVFISIHHDAPKTGRQLIFYNPDESKGAKSKALAESVWSELEKLEVESEQAGVLTDDNSNYDYLGVLKNTDMPAVLVEVSRVDDSAYQDDGFAREAANAIARGITNYA